MVLRRLLTLTAGLLAIAVILTAGTLTARGDGLIYEIPADGSWVEYKMALNGENGRNTTGTFRLSSVGEAEADGKKARWIEVKMIIAAGGNEQTTLAKLLIPVEHLGRGKKPYDNAAKAFLKRNDRDVQPLKKDDSPSAGPLPALLSGPLTDSKKLEAKEIETEAGKLKCPGVSGKYEFKDNRFNVAIDVEHRLSEKSPFGVAQCIMKFNVTRENSDRVEKGTITLSLAKSGKDAKTELPDVE